MNIFMWFITLVAFLLVMYVISYRTKESFADLLPVCTGGLLIVLYFLAFLRAMILIVPLTIGIVAFCVIKYLYGISAKKESSKVNANIENIKSIKKHIKEFVQFYINPQAIVIIVTLISLILFTSKHVATWWDDLNYWATDAKALFYLNGFPGKYGNVAPEFGDYTPGVQLMKWIFMKLSSEYKEGLAFSGYYAMGMIFLLPLLKPIKSKNVIWQIFGMAAVLLLPGVCNKVWSEGTCADVIMGIVFGALLVAIFDNENHRVIFYYSRIGIYAAILVLCKSTGFEWAIYALLFLVIFYFHYKKENKELYIKGTGKVLLLSILFPILIQGIWWSFCLINRRIAKLTSTGIYTVRNGGYSISGYFSEKFGNFIKGFAFCPMHTDKTFLFDISSLEMVIIILLVIIILSITNIISKKESKILFIYALIVSILTYGIILVGHITIFAVETQYDTPEVMAISLSRYASPFTIGMLMLIIYIIISRNSKPLVAIGCLCFILLSTNYSAAYNTIWGYRNNIENDISMRAQVVDDAGYKYINTVSTMTDLWGHRVLYLRDNDSIHWIKDTYINYFVSPVPTVYAGFDAQTYTTEDILRLLKENHASYLYVDEQAEDADSIFSSILNEDRFEYGKVYCIIDNGNGISLRKMNN